MHLMYVSTCLHVKLHLTALEAQMHKKLAEFTGKKVSDESTSILSVIEQLIDFS